MTTESLRQKLLELICDDRDFYIQKDMVDALIAIVCDQRQALELYSECYNCGSENRQCTSHHADAKQALAAGDERLKAMGVEI